MPIQATVINNYDPPVSINIHEESATQNKLLTTARVGLYSAVSGGAFSIMGLAIAGIANAGPWALVPCNTSDISDTCKRLAAVTPAAVRCLTDTAILGRKLLCGGGGGDVPNPYLDCIRDECLWRRQHLSDDAFARRIGLGYGVALGLGLGIGFAVGAIMTPMLARANAQRQAQPETVELVQSAGTVPTLHASAGPSAAVQERQAIASSKVNVFLISNPDGQVSVSLNVAESASRPVAA